ncbi:hypothetical protein L1077_19785 [Pseudoalteromonas luteoviolacea]|uniref:hypothetical protein n=1 Tax=Pseudoalteromonas luteoviolacea TaxID=43657 RepID=UPI001F2E7634|nr:hypothetical protein [Pseudoalteromonas luteoviolacea]MCF6441681.1 hypothetical protein [Pseudoalteromonas luteoviolacea]
MKLRTIISLVILTVLSLSSVLAHAASTQLKGHYFLLDEEQFSNAYKISLKADGHASIFRTEQLTGTWQKLPKNLIQVQLAQPQVLGEDSLSNQETHVLKLVAFTFEPTHLKEKTHYTQHFEIWHKEANTRLTTFSQQFAATLIKPHQLHPWHLELIGKTWVIDYVDEITRPNDSDTHEKTTAKVTFHSNGTGTVEHWNGVQSRANWRISDKRLIINFQNGEDKTRYVLRIFNHIDDIGLRFIAKRTNQINQTSEWLHGHMIAQQDTVLNEELVTGQWQTQFTKHHFYPDNIAVPGVVGTATNWSINQQTHMVRKKLTHPLMGDVYTCPDNTCYISCEFYYELIAKQGNTLYLNYNMNTEAYPQGPLQNGGKWIMKVEHNDQLDVTSFDSDFLRLAHLTLEIQGQSSTYSFSALPDMDGKIVNQVSTEQGNGTFAVIEGKLHTYINQQEYIFEITKFTRNTLSVCQYEPGKNCQSGVPGIFKLNNDAPPFYQQL